ncbi:excinuclease ABC subunit UvrB [Bacteroidia bacterium]|jgi:excinuclease ABC subunit B|nr:excinuclease ABC subunit UvrB [Bacteroidia bacterium]MDA9213669.1 excinuclease ABC subunit UvrB [Bacteroidia bacterium]
MPEFSLFSPFEPKGDQPEAINQLKEGVLSGQKAQTLLGVTGSGKTFTVANVIQETKRPVLVLSHNKTLVAQLYGEFKQFFPDNAVEYFVSYYDYYQPEAFIPTTGTYIEKDLNINDEIEKLRLKTVSTLLSGRRDVIVVASVSCIYGAGNPSDYENTIIRLNEGMEISRQQLLYRLVESLYARTTVDFKRGTFRVKGDTVDVYLAYNDYAIRIGFFGDEIEEIYSFEPETGKKIDDLLDCAIYPAQIYVSPRDRLEQVIHEIQDDLVAQMEFFQQQGRYLEAKRLEERVNFDLEMIRELGYCNGIENYSRYFDRRNPGDRPFCLLDYFPKDFLLVVDESHVTIPQIRAMYGGDRSRKINLVDYGFRLPAAMDNRPLQFEEFYQIVSQAIYVSATPSEFEIQESEGVVVEQLIRPTGLLDPKIEVRPLENQVDDLIEEIDKVVEQGDRVLVTTLTKRMSEELSKYLAKLGIKVGYLHSEVKTLDRVEILRNLRLGGIDVLVGVNLLREGLDLPEVSLVAIMDADKEGFLRSETSLVQTIGRAARNHKGRVIMYADRITGSMRKTIDETERRRNKQIAHNEDHGITPTTVNKSKKEIFKQTSVLDSVEGKGDENAYNFNLEQQNKAADPILDYLNKPELEKALKKAEKDMLRAAKEMEYMEAARLRDEVEMIKQKIKECV